MNPNTLELDDIAVVDSHLADYEAMLASAELEHFRIGLFRTGEAALRSPSAAAAGLWMVNTQLPDIAGVALLQTIMGRSPRPSVFLVGEVYSREEELAARAAGATSYFCKPATATWLQGYRRRIRAPAVRAGPAFSPARGHP